jgi:hypothetical protein
VKQIRQRLTYANVMSSIAVFLVLGGATAFAASQLGKNTVGSKQLKANSVTAGKIKNGAVTPSKISVAAQNALKGATGPVGPKGATGATGAIGATGATGAPGAAIAYAQVEANGTVIAAHSKNVTTANVQHVSPGGYCFHDLGFTPQSGVATLINFEVGEITTGVAPDKLGAVCTIGDVQARIETYDSTGGAADKGFMIIFN